MVLHTFRVATGDFRTDAQHQQEIFDYLMSLAAFLRQLLPSAVKNTPRQGIISISPMVASRLSILATVGCETPDEQPCLPDELPHFPDQVRNQLNVIINQLAPMRLSDLAEPFNVLFHVH